jgi:hypothetical protein
MYLLYKVFTNANIHKCSGIAANLNYIPFIKANLVKILSGMFHHQPVYVLLIGSLETTFSHKGVKCKRKSKMKEHFFKDSCPPVK